MVTMVRFDIVAFAQMLTDCSGGVQGWCGGRQLSRLQGHCAAKSVRWDMDIDIDMDIVILFVLCML